MVVGALFSAKTSTWRCGATSSRAKPARTVSATATALETKSRSGFPIGWSRPSRVSIDRCNYDHKGGPQPWPAHAALLGKHRQAVVRGGCSCLCSGVAEGLRVAVRRMDISVVNLHTTLILELKNDDLD